MEWLGETGHRLEGAGRMPLGFHDPVDIDSLARWDRKTRRQKRLRKAALIVCENLKKAFKKPLDSNRLKLIYFPCLNFFNRRIDESR